MTQQISNRIALIAKLLLAHQARSRLLQQTDDINYLLTYKVTPMS